MRHLRELLNGRRALKVAKTVGDEAAVTAARQQVAAVRAGEAPLQIARAEPPLQTANAA